MFPAPIVEAQMSKHSQTNGNYKSFLDGLLLDPGVFL